VANSFAQFEFWASPCHLAEVMENTHFFVLFLEWGPLPWIPNSDYCLAEKYKYSSFIYGPKIALHFLYPHFPAVSRLHYRWVGFSFAGKFTSKHSV